MQLDVSTYCNTHYNIASSVDYNVAVGYVATTPAFLNRRALATGRCMPGFLELLLSAKVCLCVCVCVCFRPQGY